VVGFGLEFMESLSSNFERSTMGVPMKVV
jgi:hypothetical protein